MVIPPKSKIENGSVAIKRTEPFSFAILMRKIV